MSDCDVCLSGFDGTAEFFYERRRKARKQHRCDECKGTIGIGEEYLQLGGKCEGDFWHENVCTACFEISNVFSCGNGGVWGGFWEEMWDCVMPDLKVTSPCFNKLSMPARAKLTEQWWKWKELQS